MHIDPNFWVSQINHKFDVYIFLSEWRVNMNAHECYYHSSLRDQLDSLLGIQGLTCVWLKKEVSGQQSLGDSYADRDRQWKSVGSSDKH